LEQAVWLLRVGDQHVLGLLVVRHHHQVVFAAQTGFLVTTKRGVSWVVVLVVNPHATCLDIAASAVCGVLSTCPHTSAQAIVGVIGNLDGLVVVLKGCYCQDWSKDLILEDLHVIGATEDGGLDVVAVFESFDLVDSTTDECLRAFFWA